MGRLECSRAETSAVPETSRTLVRNQRDGTGQHELARVGEPFEVKRLLAKVGELIALGDVASQSSRQPAAAATDRPAALSAATAADPARAAANDGALQARELSARRCAGEGALVAS